MTCGVSGTSDNTFGLPNAAVLGSGKGDLLLVCGDSRRLVEAVDLRCGLGDRVGAKIRSSTSSGSEGQEEKIASSSAVVQVCNRLQSLSFVILVRPLDVLMRDRELGKNLKGILFHRNVCYDITCNSNVRTMSVC